MAFCLAAELACVFVVVRWTSPSKSVEVSAISGVAYVAWLKGDADTRYLNSLPPGLFVRPRMARPLVWPPGGRFYSIVLIPAGSVHGVCLPFWVPALAAALPAALLWRLDRRRLPGACVRCGYDLAGVLGGTCPECGAPIAREKAEEARGGASSA